MTSRIGRGLALCAFMLAGWSGRAGAQRMDPVAFNAASAGASSRSHSAHEPGGALPAAPATRGRHVALGAVVGALVGGVTFVLLNQQDHSGEGLSDSTVLTGGALLGGLLGALVGVALPTNE